MRRHDMSREWRTFDARSQFPELLTRLPSKYESRAPRWDGSPLSFQEFLDEYSGLCDELGIFDDEKKVTSLLRYAPNSDVRYMWKMLSTDPRVRADWNEYRTTLVENTPGAEEDLRYTKADLEDLIRTSQNMPLRTLTDLSSYWERFFVVSEFLHANGRLSDGQRYDSFLKGLPERLRRRVQTQIRFEYPTKYPDDPLPLKDTFRITSFVLSARSLDVDDIDSHSHSSRQPSAPVPLNDTPDKPRIVNTASDGTHAIDHAPHGIVTPRSTSTLVQAISSFRASMEAFSATLRATANVDVVLSVPQTPARSQQPTYIVQDREHVRGATSQDRSPADTTAPSNVYTLSNTEAIDKYAPRPSELPSTPFTATVSLLSPLPPRQVDVHVNEIFTTTSPSGNEDEISQLEKALQNSQKQLQAARSKARSLSSADGQKNEHTPPISRLREPIKTSATSRTTTNVAPAPQHPYRTMNVDSETLCSSAERTLTSGASPIVVATYELESTPLENEAQSLIAVQPAPLQRSLSVEYTPLESIVTASVEDRPLAVESSTPLDSHTVRLQPLFPVKSAPLTPAGRRLLSVKSSASAEYHSFEYQPLVHAESKPSPFLHPSFSLALAESARFMFIESCSLTSSSSSVEYRSVEQSVSVEFTPSPPVESRSRTSRPSTCIDHRSVSLLLSLSVEFRSFESHLLVPLVSVVSPPSPPPESRSVTPQSSTSVESESHTPIEHPQVPSPIDAAAFHHAPQSPLVDIPTTDRKTLGATNTPGARNLNNGTERTLFDPGGCSPATPIANELAFQQSPPFDLPSLVCLNSTAGNIVFGFWDVTKHGPSEYENAIDVEPGGYFEDGDMFANFGFRLALPFCNIPRSDPPLPTHTYPIFVLTASQNEKVPGRCGDACAPVRRHHQLPNPAIHVCSRSIGAVPRISRARCNRFPCQGPLSIVLSLIPVARSVALSNGLAHLRRY